MWLGKWLHVLILPLNWCLLELTLSVSWFSHFSSHMGFFVCCLPGCFSWPKLQSSLVHTWHFFFLLLIGSWNHPGKTCKFSENRSFAFPAVTWATGPEGATEKIHFAMWQEASLVHCYLFSQGTRVLVRFLITELCVPAIVEQFPANWLGWLHSLNSAGQDGTCPKPCCCLLLAVPSHSSKSKEATLPHLWLFHRPSVLIGFSLSVQGMKAGWGWMLGLLSKFENKWVH